MSNRNNKNGFRRLVMPAGNRLEVTIQNDQSRAGASVGFKVCKEKPELGWEQLYVQPMSISVWIKERVCLWLKHMLNSMLEESMPSPHPNSPLPVYFLLTVSFLLSRSYGSTLSLQLSHSGEVGPLLLHFKTHSCLRLPTLSVIRVKEGS